MEVLTKCVDFENEKFVLFKDKKAGLPEYYKNGEYYGTIPYTELDENGKLKRRLNGLGYSPFKIYLQGYAPLYLRGSDFAPSLTAVVGRKTCTCFFMTSAVFP